MSEKIKRARNFSLMMMSRLSGLLAIVAFVACTFTVTRYTVFSVTDKGNTVLVDRFKRPLPTITFYIKTSTRAPYYNRAKMIDNTWGRNLTNIYYLIDSKNLSITKNVNQTIYVQGTESQHYYKTGLGNKADAFKAQRLKTRAVFLNYRETDWICYMDDDMVVNMFNLQKELQYEKGILGDVSNFKGTWYTMGGWCMDKQHAIRIKKVLETHTDENIEWRATDDVSFAIALKKTLNFTIKNSSKWFSQHSKITSLHKKVSIRAIGYFSMKCETNKTIVLKTLEDASAYWQGFKRNYVGKIFAGNKCRI